MPLKIKRNPEFPFKRMLLAFKLRRESVEIKGHLKTFCRNLGVKFREARETSLFEKIGKLLCMDNLPIIFAGMTVARGVLSQVLMDNELRF